MSVFIRTTVKDDKKYDYNNNEKTSETSSNSSENEMPDTNLVKLSLNKPKEWKWELATSKSSPHIAFPVIQLFDSATGNLLVEANEDDSVYQGNEKLERQIIKGVSVPITHVRSKSNTIHDSLRERNKLEVPLARSRSSSSKKSLLETIENQVVNKFVETLNEQGIKCNVRSRSVSKARSIIHEEEEPKKTEVKTDQKTHFLRVSSALNKSQSAAAISSAGGKQKKYSRSSSSVRFTTSFLQRVSECRDDSSSTSDSELMDDARQKRYFYRSSKAGTLLLCEESFNLKKENRNRRSRNLDIIDDNNNCTQPGIKNDKISTEEGNKEIKVLRKSVRKSSSKLKFAPTKGGSDENCIMPEEIEKELNLNCVTKRTEKANNNDKSSSTTTEKQSLEENNATDYLFEQEDSEKRKSVIQKSILSKSNNDLSVNTAKMLSKGVSLVRDQTSPLQSQMRYSCGDFLMENLIEDDKNDNKSNAYKRLNRRRRTKHQRSTSVGNNVTNSSRAFNNGGSIKNSSTSTDDDDIDEFVEKMGTKAQQLRLQRPERGKKRSRQNNIIESKNPAANTDEKINGKSFVNSINSFLWLCDDTRTMIA